MLLGSSRKFLPVLKCFLLEVLALEAFINGSGPFLIFFFFVVGERYGLSLHGFGYLGVFCVSIQILGFFFLAL